MTERPAPQPGAVAVVSAREGDNQAAREAVLRAFHGNDANLFAEGPLTLAWNGAGRRAVGVSAEFVCLLEGELYDLDGLREIAQRDGTAEQLLACAFQRRGPSLFSKLRGEFWALLWDRSRQTGALVTDHLGTRSPFWAHQQGSLLFASEVRDLLEALARRPDPDPVVVAHWLLGTANPGGRTLYAGCRRLEAGHWLPLSTESSQPKRFWSPRYRKPLDGSRDELVSRLRDTLTVAVTRRLASSKSPGVLLSGGIDSSAVAAIAAAAGRPLRAYSATFPDYPTVDESPLIDATVRRLAMPWTRIVVRSGSVLAGGLDYLDAWRLPPSSPNLYFWIPLLRQAAQDGTDVMLDGEGGDETFSMSPYLIADYLRRGRWLALSRMIRGWPPPALPDSRHRLWVRLRRFGLKGAFPASAHRLSRRVRRLERAGPPWLRSDAFAGWLATETSAIDWKLLSGPRWWSWLFYTIAQGIGPALVYEQSRRRTAWFGIDARHPLVDPDVIELVLRLPPEISYDSRYSRPLLRDAVDGLLPEQVRVRREKSNFDAPFRAFLAGSDLPVVRGLLEDRHAALREFVDLDLLCAELLDPGPPAEGPSLIPWGWRVWRLVMAECWLRSQEDPSFARRLRSEARLALADEKLIVR